MITLAMLVRDPPIDRLAMLLDYVRPVVSQTVIVVDDRTAAPLPKLGAEIVPFTWIDDFAAARNAALPHCKGDWILHLDPDELPSADMLAFLGMVDRSEWGDVGWSDRTHYAPRGYLFWTRNWFDGVQGQEWEEHWHCRLFRRNVGQWYKPVHEQVMLAERSESFTRETPWLPKAPRSAYLIHSRMNRPEIDAQYAAIGEKGRSGA